MNAAILQSNEDWLADYIAAEASRREALHVNHASSRPLSVNYEIVGLAGEMQLARMLNQFPDMTARPGGDHGVDFVVNVPMTVDVKTARKAGNLIHEQGKPFCDIYVLAEYDDNTKRAALVGWEWGKTLQRAPCKDFGYAVVNHYIERARLRSMAALWKRLNIVSRETMT